MTIKLLKLKARDIDCLAVAQVQHSIQTAARFKSSKVLAIDYQNLSSLAYAKRKTKNWVMKI